MKKNNRRDRMSVHVEGDIPGQIAIGNNINQTQTLGEVSTKISETDLETLHNLIENLKQQISTSAPADQREKAIEKVSELEEAITAKKPDLTTMEYVKNWFVKNLPQLAGAVTGLVVNPIVGKLVEASGEVIAHEFKRRFGLS